MDQDLPAPAGYRRDHRDSVDSTNTAALVRARTGDPGGLWVTAGMQTGGRGRSGRHWVSEPGNLYASLLLIDPAPIKHLPELALVAAVALACAVEDTSGINHPVKLKWPNDVLVEDRKISGILLESSMLSHGANAVVVGFGVNITHHPDEAHYPTSSISALGGIGDHEILFAALARSVADRLAEWDMGAGFIGIRDAWLARAVGLGEPIRVRLTDRVLEGRFADLDSSGRLVLEDNGGKRTLISAGDVFFPGSDADRHGRGPR